MSRRSRGIADFLPYIGIGLIVLIVAGGILWSCANPQSRARNWGGDIEITLEPGEKLEEATWKDDDLWYMTRPMTEDEEPETHTFKVSTVFGVFEGTVTFVEQPYESSDSQ